MIGRGSWRYLKFQASVHDRVDSQYHLISSRNSISRLSTLNLLGLGLSDIIKIVIKGAPISQNLHLHIPDVVRLPKGDVKEHPIIFQHKMTRLVRVNETAPLSVD